jgi:restriction system protein
MARRRKDTDLVSLLELPWPLTAAVAVAGFVLLRWIAPATLKGSMAIALTPTFRLLSWAVLIGFGLISFAAMLRARSAQQKVETLHEPRREPTLSSKTIAAMQPGFELDEDWDKSLKGAHQLRTAAEESRSAPQTEWSMDVLRRMEWKRLELVAAAYYRRMGFRAETIRGGADGGVDIKIFRGDLPDAVSIVQCKAWTSRPVGVKPVRELLGVMTSERVKTGVFLTTGSYTDEAIRFAEGNKLALVNGEQFLAKIKALPSEAAVELLGVATEGDWTTPSCPSCGVKMVLRAGGAKPFWGCANFPRCRHTFFANLAQ